MKQSKKFDILIVGAGHAGVEAAVMASRMGANTGLITFSKEDIGTLSCNPAMGGLGKGHLIREIDAMGGLIGRASDRSGIQFRVLNKTRGEAVQGPRAQIDRDKYKANMSNLIASEKITMIYDEVEDVLIEKNSFKKKVKGLILKNNGRCLCKALIITTGTFLKGVIHQGAKSWSAGRINSKPSIKLSNFFKNYKFQMLRLKTGTPPRLCSKSINFDICTKQQGDKDPEAFSFMTEKLKTNQIDCFITHTNLETHDIVKKNIHKSPIFDGRIQSRGPRYCPSLEDKVHRFETKDKHQIFLEPETIENKVIYPNGISTSLPIKIQEKFLRTIEGLENVRINQFGYSIEYDCIDSKELNENYETKKISGLFLAGQINGTTGYEEAAAQGLLAGINAGLGTKGHSHLSIARSQAYLGVLTSDLCRGGLVEPYRMFTSRAEYRLLLRADNADERLTDLAIKLGVIEKIRKKIWFKKKKLLQKANTMLKNLKGSPQLYAKFGIKINQDGKKRSAYEILGYKDVTWNKLKKVWPVINSLSLDNKIERQIKINSFYDRYSERQKMEILELEKDKSLKISKKIDYKKCSGLSNEVKELLFTHKPNNIKEARLLPGMTPAAASILLRFVKNK